MLNGKRAIDDSAGVADGRGLRSPATAAVLGVVSLLLMLAEVDQTLTRERRTRPTTPLGPPRLAVGFDGDQRNLHLLGGQAAVLPPERLQEASGRVPVDRLAEGR